MFGMDARPAEQITHGLGIYRMLHFFARRDFARNFPCHRTDLPLELSHPALAGVVRHH